MAGELVNGVFERGFECYGIPIGSDNFVKHKLQVKADDILKDARQTVKWLSSNRQSLWSALRLSICHRFVLPKVAVQTSS